MEALPRGVGPRVKCPNYVRHERGYTFCAVADGKNFAVKRREWPTNDCLAFLIRHGAEFLYYVLAKHNGLPMPPARVIEINGKDAGPQRFCQRALHFGRRMRIGHSGLRKTLQLRSASPPAERKNFLRATFLDVLLLAADRTEYNVLKEDEVEIRGQTLCIVVDSRRTQREADQNRGRSRAGARKKNATNHKV